MSAIAAGAVEPVTFVGKAMPDFDRDGIVGFSDFLQFVEQFGFSQDDERYDARFDLGWGWPYWVWRLSDFCR